MKNDIKPKGLHINKEYCGISLHTQKLLNSQKGLTVNYMKCIEDLQCSDLVAFANSEYGGTILIGVQEIIDIKGVRKVKVIGCLIGNNERLKIVNKAISCIPEIEIEIIYENLDNKPIIRIEIPSGKFKPYCTSSGIYLIRGDGKNIPLNPNSLLNIF